MIIAPRYQRLLGVRACRYIEQAIITHSRDGAPMLAERHDAPPPHIARTLTRVLGKPRIPGDGEVAYWDLSEATRA